jgi:hypothetical protein
VLSQDIVACSNAGGEKRVELGTARRQNAAIHLQAAFSKRAAARFGVALEAPET